MSIPANVRLHPRTANRIVSAVRRANRALDRQQRWHRIATDALNRGDLALAAKAERLHIRALRDFRAAEQAMKFPWEVE